MKWELGAFFFLFMSKAVTINYFSIYNFLVFDLLFVLHNNNTILGLKDFTIFKRIFSSKKFNLIFFLLSDGKSNYENKITNATITLSHHY